MSKELQDIEAQLRELNEKLERQHWVLESIAESLITIAEQSKKGIKVDVLR
jgi:hypothetical protein